MKLKNKIFSITFLFLIISTLFYFFVFPILAIKVLGHITEKIGSCECYATSRKYFPHIGYPYYEEIKLPKNLMESCLDAYSDSGNRRSLEDFDIEFAIVEFRDPYTDPFDFLEEVTNKGAYCPSSDFIDKNNERVYCYCGK